MSVNTIEWKGNLSAGTAGGVNSLRGPSPTIWADCPVHDLIENPALGMYFWDDFLVSGSANMGSAYQNSIGQWASYGYAAATETDGLLEGGVLRLAPVGDNIGLTLLSSSGSFRLLTTSTLALNQKLWFECRIAKSSIASAHLTAFVGLMTPTLTSGLPTVAQPLTTTDDALSTAVDLFGFKLDGTTSTRGGPTEAGVAFNLTSGTVNYPTNLTTLMASTGNTVLAAAAFVKLGFLFDPQPTVGPRYVTSATARQTAGNLRKPLIRFFVNGVEAPAFLSSDDVQNATAAQAFPTGFMCPAISVMNMASQSADYLAIDWIRVAQLGNS